MVVGPKFCGKTTTCMRFQKSFIRLNTGKTIALGQMVPKAILRGDEPRLIDEWQTVPDVWNQVKNSLDEDYRFGRFLLTGSSTPSDKGKIYHSGAGRITPIKMRTMSLFESEESRGLVSLEGLFKDPNRDFPFDLNERFSLLDAAYLICRGGWPISVQEDKDLGLEITYNYYNSLFVFENCENERFRNKRPEVLKAVLRSYARNISTEASNATLLADVASNAGMRSFDNKTFVGYLDALRDLYIIEDKQAWNPNIRSKTSIRCGPTRHFTDPSLACRALNMSPSDLLNDLNSFGLFFEDLAMRDLDIYASELQGEIRHYRDNAGLECDAVIHLPSGEWAAVEIKLGGESLVEEGAQSLLRFQKKLKEKSDETAPSFLMVLTASGPLYKRKDGIFVVPINCLRP